MMTLRGMLNQLMKWPKTQFNTKRSLSRHRKQNFLKKKGLLWACLELDGSQQIKAILPFRLPLMVMVAERFMSKSQNFLQNRILMAKLKVRPHFHGPSARLSFLKRLEMLSVSKIKLPYKIKLRQTKKFNKRQILLDLEDSQ